jgi:hypothetical protein
MTRLAVLTGKGCRRSRPDIKDSSVHPGHAVYEAAWLLFLLLDYTFNVDACIGKL